MTKGSPSNAALQGLLAASRKQAQRRNQRPTTAHCMLEMLQSDLDAGGALRSAGVQEVGLVGALKMAGEETELVLERVSDRALQIAQRHDTSGATVVRPVHLLYAICSEPRSAAAQCLERLGISALRVQRAAPSPRQDTKCPSQAEGRARSAFAR